MSTFRRPTTFEPIPDPLALAECDPDGFVEAARRRGIRLTRQGVFFDPLRRCGCFLGTALALKLGRLPFQPVFRDLVKGLGVTEMELIGASDGFECPVFQPAEGEDQEYIRGVRIGQGVAAAVGYPKLDANGRAEAKAS
jgi:hypothetical protein